MSPATKARPSVHAATRLLERFRPRLELLEDRLPPGDALGGLFAWSLLGPAWFALGGAAGSADLALVDPASTNTAPSRSNLISQNPSDSAGTLLSLVPSVSTFRSAALTETGPSFVAAEPGLLTSAPAGAFAPLFQAAGSASAPPASRFLPSDAKNAAPLFDRAIAANGLRAGEAASLIPLASGADAGPGGNGSGSYLTPLSPADPAGSRVYVGEIMEGFLGTPSEVDSYTLNVDPGQSISVIVRPATAGLQPAVDLSAFVDGDLQLLASGVAAAAGQPATVSAVPTVDGPLDTTYRIDVRSASTAGAYTLQVLLNTALEDELYGGAVNDSLQEAQDLDAAFTPLVAGVKSPSASRAAVVGRSDLSAGALPEEEEPNNTQATANLAVANFLPFKGNLFHLGIKGNVDPANDQDWYRIGMLQVNDIITITQSGAASERGTNRDTLFQVLRGPAAAPVFVTSDDDGGTGLDSMIYRFRITTTDTYYINAGGFGGNPGTYDLAVFLEDNGEEPMTGGTLTRETEPNNNALTANDASTSWRRVEHHAQTAAAINLTGDIDFYQYQFTQGDLVSLLIDSTSAADVNVRLRNAAGLVLASENGDSSFTGADSVLNGFIIPATGEYFVEVRAAGTGAYTANIYLASNKPPPGPTVGLDYYSLSLAAGDTLTVGLHYRGSVLSLELLDAEDKLLAVGGPGATNVNTVISNFIAPEDGRYYLRITGLRTREYNLFASRNADFDFEDNDTIPQPLAARSVDGVRWVYGNLGRMGIPAGIRVLHFVDQAVGPDTFTPAYFNLGITPAIAGTFADFVARLQGGEWDMVSVFNQGPPQAAWVTPLVNYVNAGGRAIVFASRVPPGSTPAVLQQLAAAFGGQYTPRFNQTSVTPVTAHRIWEGVEVPLGLRNPGWPEFSSGLQATTGLSLGQFPNGDDAIIVGNNGRTILNGFSSDATAIVADGRRLAENQIRFVAGNPFPSDQYQVNLKAGALLTLTTFTPASQAGTYRSDLDPQVILYDPQGKLVAFDDNSGGDGRNARLEYKVPAAGTYTIQVTPSQATKSLTNGDYTLAVSGAS